jgi:hypothetical protein
LLSRRFIIFIVSLRKDLNYSYLLHEPSHRLTERIELKSFALDIPYNIPGHGSHDNLLRGLYRRGLLLMPP